jgi:hypothetical protein
LDILKRRRSSRRRNNAIAKGSWVSKHWYTAIWRHERLCCAFCRKGDFFKSLSVLDKKRIIWKI